MPRSAAQTFVVKTHKRITELFCVELVLLLFLLLSLLWSCYRYHVIVMMFVIIIVMIIIMITTIIVLIMVNLTFIYFCIYSLCNGATLIL